MGALTDTRYNSNNRKSNKITQIHSLTHMHAHIKVHVCVCVCTSTD